MQRTKEREHQEGGDGRTATRLRLRTTLLCGVIMGITFLLALVGTFVSVRGAVGVIALIIGLMALIPISLICAYVVTMRHDAVVEITWIDRYRCPECGALGTRNATISSFMRQYGDSKLRNPWECENRHVFFVNRFGFPFKPKQAPR